jgi:hypothetical protein
MVSNEAEAERRLRDSPAGNHSPQVFINPRLSRGRKKRGRKKDALLLAVEDRRPSAGTRCRATTMARVAKGRRFRHRSLPLNDIRRATKKGRRPPLPFSEENGAS